MPRRNFLLGQGERLTLGVSVPKGGGTKNEPYDLDTAKTRLGKDATSLAESLEGLPPLACPGGETVAIITMHPRYVAKSDFPTELLREAGLRPVGSRAREIHPEEWGILEPPATAQTEQLFVAGALKNFEELPHRIRNWQANDPAAKHLSHIEAISPFSAADKVKVAAGDSPSILLEVVLHNAGEEAIIDAFQNYASALSATAMNTRARWVGGLTFLPVLAEVSRVEDLAAFSFVRVARTMPTLRPLVPGLIRAAGQNPPFDIGRTDLPDGAPKAVVFDGGIPAGIELSPLVDLIEPPGIGPSHPDLERHGLAVTSALLYGPLDRSDGVAFCSIDHVRVLDETLSGGGLQYVDVLDRITRHLDAKGDDYQFANISLGPNLPVEDDDVTAWTAVLDQYFAGGKTLATVAAGNNGDLDSGMGLNRIQPPADGVNVLSVGATSSRGRRWARADYSCVGPGRNPGIVKPDGVIFGGSDSDQFAVLGGRSKLVLEWTQGTSFAAPLALRSAVGVWTILGATLGPLAIRSLLVHRADRGGYESTEVGWGLLDTDIQRLITCDDHEVITIYQGTLPVGQHLRAPVPMPATPVKGRVTLSATLLIAPDVDPENPSTYTRGGLEAAFRPHADRYRHYPNGSRSQEAKTAAFFSVSNMYGSAEYRFREDGSKWEPCLKSSRRFNSSSLYRPTFDIYYHHREGGSAGTPESAVEYALVISLQAPKTKDLYNQVVRAYSQILVPLAPRIEIPIST